MVRYDAQPKDKLYFSVKASVIIAGVPYRPSICYKMSDLVAPAILTLEAKGAAVTYAEKVRFVNGVARAIPAE